MRCTCGGYFMRCACVGYFMRYTCGGLIFLGFIQCLLSHQLLVLLKKEPESWQPSLPASVSTSWDRILQVLLYLILIWPLISPAMRVAPAHLEVLCTRELTKWSSVNRLPSCASLPPRVAHQLLAALAEAKQLHPKTLTAFLKWYEKKENCRGKKMKAMRACSHLLV